MLSALTFVQGAVAKKDFVPELTHFRIKDGRILGYNGALALCSPIDLDLDTCPKADTFIKAVKACSNEVISLHITPGGKLSIKSGAFKALIECLPNVPDSLVSEPEGVEIDLFPGLLHILKKLYPFIAEDATRTWARGILFRDNTAIATNNIVIIEHRLDYISIPVEVNIPKNAITEMIRINEDPVKMMVSKNSVTFFYENERWLTAQTYTTDWPDTQRVFTGSKGESLPNLVWNAIEQILPFADEIGTLCVDKKGVSTHLSHDNGAKVEIEGIEYPYDSTVLVNIEQFYKLRNVITSIDLTSYPNPMMFYGEDIRGAIVGMRPR